jgi:adenosylmethionine-8-amino-7-oxononanoate aminotransferase
VGATTGCVPAPAGYFAAIKEVCEKYGVLLVLDEIMCGSKSNTPWSKVYAKGSQTVGRSGKMHAWQWEGAQPDLQVVGKALGGGYAPISAILISKKVVDVFRQGSGAFNNGNCRCLAVRRTGSPLVIAGHTFQSHVIGCRVALEILKVFEQDRLVEQCYQRGLLLEKMLHARLDNHPNVGDIR